MKKNSAYNGKERRKFVRLDYLSPLAYKVCKKSTISKILKGYTSNISQSGLLCNIKDKVKKKMLEYKDPVRSSANYDATRALVSLGFPERKAEEAVNYAASNMKDATAEALIKAALVKLKER